MIETWLILFLIIFIRNKFIQKLEKENVYLWKQYNMKLVFKEIYIYLPLLFLILYLILEVLIFNNITWFLPYGAIIKQVTLLSYLGLIVRYELYNSMYEKYRDKGFIAFITSPFSLAIFCLCVGYFFNYIAIVSNNYHMPLFNDLSYWSGYTDIHSFTVDSFYILGDYKSKYIIFCDIIDLGYTTLSIGDVFIRFYPFVILFFSIKKSNEMKK